MIYESHIDITIKKNMHMLLLWVKKLSSFLPIRKKKEPCLIFLYQASNLWEYETLCNFASINLLFEEDYTQYAPFYKIYTPNNFNFKDKDLYP